MSSKLAADLSTKSHAFWHALFAILDDVKYRPNLLEFKGKPCSIDLGDGFILKATNKRVWMVDVQDGHKTFGVQPHVQKGNNFPYTKVLDAYLKRSVLNKLS